jgi:hypothetical protein
MSQVKEMFTEMGDQPRKNMAKKRKWSGGKSEEGEVRNKDQKYATGSGEMEK